MRELQLVLEYHCGACGHFVSATVRCSGKGLAAGPHTVAAVKVPCPRCDGTSQLYFEPCGHLVAVEPFQGLHEQLVASRN